jgi:hypothetical protein
VVQDGLRGLGAEKEQRRLFREHSVAGQRHHELQQVDSGTVQEQVVSEAALTGGSTGHSVPPSRGR